MTDDISEWTNRIVQGDARETMLAMPESSVHCVVTSPPYYGLRDYGVEGQLGLEDTLTEFIEELVAVGDAVRHVLRPDGNWFLNFGDSFCTRRRARKTNAEQEIADVETERTNEDYSPTSEGDGRYHNTSLTDHGMSLVDKDKMLVPHRVAIALQEAGWVVRGDYVWSKPNPMPHPVKDRLREDKEFVFHLTPEPHYWFDLDAIREPYSEYTQKMMHREESGVERGAERPHSGIGDSSNTRAETVHPNGKNPGDVLEIPTKPYPDAHYAVYPEELPEPFIKAGCPPEVCAACGTPYERDREVEDREVAGGVSRVPEDERGYADRQGTSQNDREGLTQPVDVKLGPWEQQCDCDTDETKPGVVLDPFCGRGTTAIVAKDLGRRWVGIDLDPDSVALAQRDIGLTVDDPERLPERDKAQRDFGHFINGEIWND